ncbi:cysteine-rich protein 2-binding protein isoform X1 [Latimeria chalumnae]|uniref:cysteine-rich protein 2-binding protein isoform X1 n=1 Tax=Latimeria chalumnae TaxID=7897 RepID=UPI0006D8EA73|nr:PREDICTED: cysteine-rich protein 2-binding protein isoform X1 [Latimeria chalumnae]|eukprot:XP_014342096.1 PREDICTED: cysteine-rich protein 2-binding protein isoform X1 [Latimeria chalumnae]
MDDDVDMRGLASRRVDDDATRTSTSEGLEEGEVEGETLLIVESEDQASVDLSHDQSGDSLNSDLGDEGETSWTEEMSYYCEKCQRWIASGQLRGESPSYLKGDNFFRFICSDCSDDAKEHFERLRLTWQQVVMLAMYNLSLEGTGRQGYFRWKEDICAFIEKHWTFLLGSSRKKTTTWWSTVAGCLSVGSPLFFRSGAQEFGEPGWWKLVHNKPPTMRPEGEKLSASALKAKAACKPSLDPTITVEGLRKRISRNPVETAMELKEKRSRTQEAKDIRRAQKEATGFMDRSASSTPVKFTSRGRRPELILERGEVIDFSSLSSSDRTPMTSPSPSPSLDFSAPGTPASHSATPSLLSEADLIPDVMPPQALFHDDEEMEGDGVIDPGIEYLPPPSMPLATGTIIVSRKKVKVPEQIKQEVESEEERTERLEGESDEPEESGPSHIRSREKKKPQPEKEDKPQAPKFVPLSLYEEKLLFKKLEACSSAVAVNTEAKRLRRKLLVRQAKRERGMPLFDLDQAVNAALTLVGGVYGAKEGGGVRLPAGVATYRTTSQEFRILDRYHTNLPSIKGPQHHAIKFLHRLIGTGDAVVDQSVISPYTSRVLKPYIRRDIQCKPPKLSLLAEIQAYPHRNDPTWKPEPEAPIDYCYVRPNHIPTINSLCHEFFWPGVDVSECLQYPDFSVVVLYKKVIIGFGFMVPDVKYNEAYISFLFVHPEWRRAGIATFMIYHLIQTCMGKDVTLHVSANNPAMLLYQKFGFKTEEYILDFYDKYYPLDSKECKHAFFLRMRR